MNDNTRRFDPRADHASPWRRRLRRTGPLTALTLLALVAGTGLGTRDAAAQTFADVPIDHWASDYIQSLAAAGVTSGYGGGNYCPNGNVTRAQLAVFLLRARYGSAYAPPPAIGIFVDTPIGSFAADFIEQLAAEGITSGCGGGNYCPNSSVTRAQMAVFLVRTFGLPIVLPPMPLTWDEGSWDHDTWQ